MFVTSVLIHFHRPLTPNQEGGPHGHFPTVGARKRGANGTKFLVHKICHKRIEIHLIDVLGDPAAPAAPGPRLEPILLVSISQALPLSQCSKGEMTARRYNWRYEGGKHWLSEQNTNRWIFIYILFKSRYIHILHTEVELVQKIPETTRSEDQQISRSEIIRKSSMISRWPLTAKQKTNWQTDFYNI